MLIITDTCIGLCLCTRKKKSIIFIVFWFDYQRENRLIPLILCKIQFKDNILTKSKTVTMNAYIKALKMQTKRNNNKHLNLNDCLNKHHLRSLNTNCIQWKWWCIIGKYGFRFWIFILINPIAMQIHQTLIFLVFFFLPRLKIAVRI